MSCAQRELAKRQREWPLPQPTDRAAALFQALCPLQDTRLESMRLAGTLVVGEVGRPLPNAKTFPLPDDSQAVLFYSGLIDFYTAVGRILNSGTIHHAGAATTPVTNTPADDIVQLTALFQRWSPAGIAADQHITAPIPAPAADAWLAALLSDASLSLVLCHEFGHVLAYRPPTDDTPTPLLTLQQEFAADADGLVALLGAAPDQNAIRARFAGAIISMRVLAVFGDLGHSFPPHHPPPLDRLQALFTRARSLWSEREFWTNAPIAYAFDEKLEVAGLRATGNLTAEPPLTADRCFSRLSSTLEAFAVSRISADTLIHTVSPDLEQASSQVIQEISAIAARMFPVTPATTGNPRQDEMWTVKGNILRHFADRWPHRPEPSYHLVFHPNA